MNELQIIVSQETGMISANFEEIKQGLVVAMEDYKMATYTEDTMNIAKKDAATLKKLKKEIDKKRIEVKKKHMLPYEKFESMCNELKELIDEPIALIEAQVEAYEAHEREEKKVKVTEYFKTATTGLEEYIPIDIFFKLQWLNKTVSFKSIKEDIDTLVKMTETDINTIISFESEVEEKALNNYRINHQLSQSIRIINDYEKQKAEILAREEAKKREEAERLRQEEERRIREEERVRIEEERRRKAEEERRIQEIIEQEKEKERQKIFTEMFEKECKQEVSINEKAEHNDEVEEMELPWNNLDANVGFDVEEIKEAIEVTRSYKVTGTLEELAWLEKSMSENGFIFEIE